MCPDFGVKVKVKLRSKAGADPEEGRSGRPPLFAPNSLKSLLNWTKKSWERTPEATAPPPFSNPGSSPERSRTVFCLLGLPSGFTLNNIGDVADILE